MASNSILVNRAPVLTLWGAVVAERCGHDWNAALTLGQGLASSISLAKGRNLGIYHDHKRATVARPPKEPTSGEDLWIRVCGKTIPALYTPHGIRAVAKDRPLDPKAVASYLSRAFGDSFAAALAAMTELAAAYPLEQIDSVAFGLYEKFRPKIDPGVRGWGQKGTLDLELIRSLAR